jgi:hypothetical protein
MGYYNLKRSNEKRINENIYIYEKKDYCLVSSRKAMKKQSMIKNPKGINVKT